MTKRVQPFTKYVSNQITEVMIDQDEKGLEKYGKYLDPMDDYDWLEMAREEAADMLKYFEAEQYKRDRIINEVESILSDIKRQAVESGDKVTYSKLDKVNVLLGKLSPR